MSVLASETASATAGREGRATSPDGKIDLALPPPGSKGPGTNPEQLNSNHECDSRYGDGFHRP